MRSYHSSEGIGCFSLEKEEHKNPQDNTNKGNKSNKGHCRKGIFLQAPLIFTCWK